MLSPIEPIADVFLAIGPFKSAVTLLLVLEVATLVPATIRPGKHSIAVHLIILPHSIENTPIRPLVHALSFDVVLFELSRVVCTVGPFESTLSVLLPELIVALV